MNQVNPRKNAEGYDDPTAYAAISNKEREEYKAYERVRNLLKAIFYICEMAGFRVENRIMLKDTVSGRVWK